MIRNPAKLREPSKKEGIISSTDSKSVCSQEVVTDLLPETQSLLNVPNGDLVAVKINGSNVQTNGQEAVLPYILEEWILKNIPAKFGQSIRVKMVILCGRGCYLSLGQLDVWELGKEHSP
ncbi:hypothetical protein TNCV_3421991 [Trichonephila clavipes]|nr:hypothetical protein TNCV_3421991 [Trichonephila clavipes]